MKKMLMGVLVLGMFVGCREGEELVFHRGEQMQKLAIEIADCAREQDPDFIMIVQNAPGLAWLQEGRSSSLRKEFLNKMDGFSAEALFYNQDGLVDESEKLADLDQLPDEKTVLVMDLMPADSSVLPAIDSASQHGFIASPRDSINKDYNVIPDIVPNENMNDILTLKDAENFLYLIASGNTAPDSFLQAIEATNFDVVFVDLFAPGGEPFTNEQIKRLKKKQTGQSRLVIAYMNVGAAERERYYCTGRNGRDICKEKDPEWMDSLYTGFEHEFWVKYWCPAWKDILYRDKDSYLQKILVAGFDGLIMDNMEAYAHPVQ